MVIYISTKNSTIVPPVMKGTTLVTSELQINVEYMWQLLVKKLRMESIKINYWYQHSVIVLKKREEEKHYILTENLP